MTRVIEVRGHYEDGFGGVLDGGLSFFFVMREEIEKDFGRKSYKRLGMD